MKANITEDGILRIEGENSIEKYALDKWFADFMGKDKEEAIAIIT